MTVVHVTNEGHRMTQNNSGREMNLPSPLFEEWLAGFDGTHPIADVGAAYGLNVEHALQRGIPVIAVDCAEPHLEFIRDTVGQHPLLRGVCWGKLPDELSLALPQALAQALVAGGTLCITAAHFEGALHALSPVAQQGVLAHIQEREAAGEAWPGAASLGMEGMQAVERSVVDVPENVRVASVAPQFHFHTQPSLEAGLKRAGFEIVSTTIGTHPGLPRALQFPRVTIMVVARKAQATPASQPTSVGATR